MHERLILPQQTPVPDAAAQDLAQHIAASFVRWQHAITNKEGCGARVVRNDAQRRIAQHVALHMRELGCLLDQRNEEVRLEVRQLALHHRRHALQTGAGVYGRLGQQRQLTLCAAIELHEDQVPYLDIASIVLAEGQIVARRF